MKRVRITDVQFNQLSYICDKLKIDWFYPEYFKRKTINLADLQCIYDNWKVYTPKINIHSINTLFKLCE